MINIPNSSDSQHQSDLGYGQLLKIVLRRKFWLITVISLIFPLMAIKAFMEEPIYRSSMQLLIESNYQEKQGSKLEELLPSSQLEIDYSTHLILLKSSRVLQKAIDLLKDKYPDLTIEDVQESLSVSQVLEDETITKIFSVSYTSNEPKKSQEILEHIQKVYLQYNSEQQENRLENGLSFINQQLPIIRDRLLIAQTELKEFRETHNLINPPEEAENLVKSLEQLKTKKYSLASELSQLQGTYNNLANTLNISPKQALIVSRLSQSPRYQNLLEELEIIEIKLANRRGRFQESDLGIEELKNQRGELINLIITESQKIFTEVPISEVNLDNILFQTRYSENELLLIESYLNIASEIEGLKEQISSLEQTEIELTQEIKNIQNLIINYEQLSLEINTLQNTLAELVKAQQQLSIEINRGGFTWEVIELPNLGEKVGPSLKKDLAIALIISVFLGGVVSFIVELLDSKIYSQEQLSQMLNLPVLGSFSLLIKKNKNLFWHKKNKDTKSSTNLFIHEASNIDLIFYKILQYQDQVSNHTLLITSINQCLEKTNLALGLAMSGARRHQKILVIDGKVSEANFEKILPIVAKSGLSNILNTNQISELVIPVKIGNLEFDVITAGKAEVTPIDLFTSPEFKNILQELASVYDWIFIDANPLLNHLETTYLASNCDANIIVVTLNKVNKSEIQQSLPILEIIKNLGVVTIEN